VDLSDGLSAALSLSGWMVTGWCCATDRGVRLCCGDFSTACGW